MNKWKLIALLGLTSIVSASAGIFVYRSLTVESEAFVAEQQELRAKQHTLKNKLEGSDTATAKGPTLVGATTFKVEAKGISSVTFTSDAPLESIVGNTTTASGDVTVDLADLSNTKGAVTVDLTTLKTGIDLRDEHLQGEKFLNTGAHPKAVFELTRVEDDGKPVTQGARKHVTLHGNFTVRGVTKAIAVPARVSFYRWSPALEDVYIKGDVLRIDGSFDLVLADYGIDPGSLLGKKVAKVVTVALKLTATTPAPTLEEANKS